jgi:hypothetical protein
MRIKLVRKFANVINGIDLTNVRVGDVLDLTVRDACVLIAEYWAEPMTEVCFSHSPSSRKSKSAEPGA